MRQAPDQQSCVIYVRISEDRAGSGLGVKRQEDDCRELASKLELTVRQVYNDNDITASGKKLRPGYVQMCEDIRADPATVIVWHTDRLHRNTRQLLDYLDLVQATGIATHAVKAGKMDLSTPTGRMVAVILGAIAQGELEHMIERMLSKKDELAVNGAHQGGCRPVGWRYESEDQDGKGKGPLIVVPGEAEAIDRASRGVLTGVTLAEIVRRWNQEEMGGRTWSRTTVRGVLLRPRNAGLREHRGNIVGHAAWDPIVPEAVWRAVVAKLTAPERRTTDSNRNKHLLSGLARCQFCGGGLTAHTGARGTSRVYACRHTGCGKVARHAGRLELYVTQLVIGRLRMPDARKAFRRNAASSPTVFTDQADQLRAKLAKHTELFRTDVIDADSLAILNAGVREQLADVERRLAAQVQAAELAKMSRSKDPADMWDDLTTGQRRTLISTLMTVTVGPSRMGRPPKDDPLDSSSVLIAWL